jgi:hypothetical protein
MNAKQRVRSLALGSLILTLAIYMASIWLFAESAPNAPSRPPTLNALFVWIFLWGGIFSTLRPLIPNDPREISN